MIPVLVSAIVVVVGFLVMRSLVDENRRIPPFSTLEGKKARLIIGVVVIACISSFTLSTVAHGSSILTLQAIVIGVVVALAPLLTKKQKDKHHK